MSAQLVTIDPNSLLGGRKAELLRWLAEEGRFAPDTGRLLELLCDKLAALGIPIARATAHVRTLHPEYRGASRIWRRGESMHSSGWDDDEPYFRPRRSSRAFIAAKRVR